MNKVAKIGNKKYFLQIGRTMQKDRIALYKEFIKPKITQKLEELRDKKVDFQAIKTSEVTFDEGEAVLLEISNSREFQKAMEDWKKEFDKKHPTPEQIAQDERLKRVKAQMNSRIDKNIEIEFNL